jgi:hypothetical protein
MNCLTNAGSNLGREVNVTCNFVINAIEMFVTIHAAILV